MGLDVDKEDTFEVDSDAEPTLQWQWGKVVQILAVAGILMLVGLYFLPVPSLTEGLEIVRGWGIIAFYLAFIVLTLLGVPSTVFFLIGGAAFPVTQNLLVIAIALLIHFTFAWLIGAQWMRGPLKRFLLRRGTQLPQLRSDNQWRITLLIKFTPGVPLFIKSYVLGVGGVEFVPFMTISVLSTYGLAAIFVTLGRSAMEGQIGLLLGGIAFLIFCMALFRVIREHLRTKKRSG
jgi:uncharacterized membrane protein YdjX (TVP38/TMEM64 family)